MLRRPWDTVSAKEAHPFDPFVRLMAHQAERRGLLPSPFHDNTFFWIPYLVKYVSPKPSTPVDTLDFLTLAGPKLPRPFRHACLDWFAGET